MLLKSWVEQYGDQLLRIAYAYTQNRMTAEDCLQDAFVTACRKAHQLRSKENPFPWLARIVINECKSKKRRRKEITMLHQPESVDGPEEIIVKEEMTRRVHQAVMVLPEKYRIPVILHYFEDMQLDDIAGTLKENPGTIRTRISRARQKLAKIMEEGDCSDLGGNVEKSQSGTHRDLYCK